MPRGANVTKAVADRAAMQTRLPPGHARLPAGERGLRLGLDEETFNRWWYHALLPEDASEFVHLHNGTLEGARFVCALDAMTGIDRRALSGDVITRAYCAARNLPEAEMRSPKVRYEAQALYDTDAVQELLDRVRYRAGRVAWERIAALTVAKIEDLYARTRSPEGVDDNAKSDDAAEMAMNGSAVAFDPEERRKTEALALDASLRFMANATKERSLDATRRDKRALAQAMNMNKAAARDTSALPDPENFKHFLVMVREAIGVDAFEEAIASLKPAALETTANEAEDLL